MIIHAARTILVAHAGAGLFGADRVLLESVTGLREAGCRVVVALPARGPLVAELDRVGARVEVVPMLVLDGHLVGPRVWPARVRRALLGVLGTWRMLGRVRPDLVYVSTSRIPQWPLLARLRGIRSISHIHEAERSGSRWVNRLRYLPHLASQRTLVTSRFSLETMRRTLPALARRAVIVDNGIVSPEHPPLPREPLEDPLRILFMGHLSPRAGADLALEAAILLQREGREVHVTVLGVPPEGFAWFEQQLRDQAADGDLDVDFAGFDSCIWPHLARADVVLVPSRFDEPFGTAAVEAVLALRPVIASNSSGLREAAGGYSTTRLVRPGDARALASALEAVTESWSTIVHSLAESRAAALRRHDPLTYRATIVRACGVDTSSRFDFDDD